MVMEHRCHLCHGSGRVSVAKFEGCSIKFRRCPSCKGKTYNKTLVNQFYKEMEQANIEDNSKTMINQDFEVLLIRDLLFA
jgi:excinuclease UvrABC ATPase subunit